MKKIMVTKPYLPSIDRYESYVRKIWDNQHLTNQGPLLQEMEATLGNFLGTPLFHFVTNGTVALQIALRALNITEGEVITTPFSYVATVSSILWERCEPVFVDIDPNTFCIDAAKIEAAITPKTKAIMAVHVFGYPCDVKALEDIAKRHNIKVIYDGAHAFGCTYQGKSLLAYGDIATCSFHATKVFHTIEGGCVISHNEALHRRLALVRSFGHVGDDHFELGINAKGSEFQAAMGLSNIQDFVAIQASRKASAELYDRLLPFPALQKPFMPKDFTYNYAYYPVVFKTPEKCSQAIEKLNAENIVPRRYFFPSLNTLPYLDKKISCPVSESVAARILSLPYWTDMETAVIEKVAGIVSKVA